MSSELAHLENYLIAVDTEFTPEQYDAYDKIYARYKDKTVIKLDLVNQITLVHDDITKLCVDAIVNPANSAGLGCFVPSHTCLDNTIHRRAGPRLRQACRKILQGRHLQTGEPMITNGYHLPTPHVIHVVGPIFEGQFDEHALASCYVNVLDLAERHQLKSIAFPCISTGLFGYPIEQSADCAVKTVSNWYRFHPEAKIKTVFCTYDNENYQAYSTPTFSQF